MVNYVVKQGMAKTVQARTLKTRAKLLSAAKDLIENSSYEALRVEEVVLRAGVAKGTFFSHFKDKDALMDQLIGARLSEILTEIEAGPVPKSASDMVAALRPFIAFMTSERYVFDLILRYSGATAISEIGPIAQTFGQHVELFLKWVTHPGVPVRDDIAPELLAEGISAFMIQAMSLKFCALHSSVSVEARLEPYLQAWLK